ncbi:Protein phosphatase 2C-like 1 [Porphyridium purpureum]|uniref:Protein phosphatase 2C-like 1 n=1 Tax=Porphyridium purpureum TaxID=35688 RepID=A0A5J4Z8W7_PORPP|nr:Protein phosphatase 2C-like 1 [Porphyridium purpureum]|eukprot:POR5883..scf295_1
MFSKNKSKKRESSSQTPGTGDGIAIDVIDSNSGEVPNPDDRARNGTVATGNAAPGSATKMPNSFSWHVESLSRKIYSKKGSKTPIKPQLVAIKAVGYADDPNERFRPTMEDAHVIIEKFCGLSNEAFFGIYDGHGGRDAVEIVAKTLHKFFGEEVAKLRVVVTDNGETAGVGATAGSGAKGDASADASQNFNSLAKGAAERGVIVLRQPCGMSQSSSRSFATFGKAGSADEQGGGSTSHFPSFLSDGNERTGGSGGAMSRGDSVVQKLEPVPVKCVADAYLNAYRRSDFCCLDAKCHYVGSTAVTAYIRHDGTKRILYTANAGDARAVLARGSTAIRLSFDHKANTPEEQTRIGECGGFVAAKRVNGVLSVARALGDHAMKNVIIADPYVSEYELQEDDAFLILACDGLWDVMEDDESVKFVADKFAKGMDMAQISKKLVKAALERGSMDNISVMVVRL